MNNQVIQVAEIIIGSLVSLGILIAGVGYFVSQWKQGSNTYNSSLIQNLKDLLKSEQEKNQLLLKEKNDSYVAQQAQISQLQTDIGKLQGTVEAQNKQIDQYSKQIANRNPELENTLLEIRDFLKSLSGMAITVQLRNEALDEAVTEVKK